MNTITWVVQNNLIYEKDLANLENAISRVGAKLDSVRIVPFSDELPEFLRNDSNIFYGSTTFMNNVYAKYGKNARGLFYDDKEFSMENYMEKWGREMLSYGAKFMTFDEFVNSPDMDPEQDWFVRPDADSKSFAGDVIKFKDIAEWHSKLLFDDIYGLSGDTKIMVSTPYNIAKEWRCLVVNGKYITGSQYRGYLNLVKDPFVPEEVIQYVEDRAKEYSPHDVFVMDIGLSGENYYIIECGCANSIGFYEMDVYEYVKAITNYIAG